MRVARPMPHVLAPGGCFFHFVRSRHCLEELDVVRAVSGVLGGRHRRVADRVGMLKRRKGPVAFFLRRSPQVDTAAI